MPFTIAEERVATVFSFSCEKRRCKTNGYDFQLPGMCGFGLGGGLAFRNNYLGYICKKARTVANGLSAGLFVPIMCAAMSFSHSLLFAFARRPPVTSRYAPILLVKDSCMPSPNKRNTFFSKSWYCVISSRAS